MPDPVELGLHVGHVHRLAVLAPGHVELHGVGVKPLERQVLDLHRGLAGDRAVVVPGRVHVGGAVGAELGELVVGPALAVAQQPRGHAEQRLDLGRAGGVIGLVDLHLERLEQFRRALADRRGEVDQGHRVTPGREVVAHRADRHLQEALGGGRQQAAARLRRGEDPLARLRGQRARPLDCIAGQTRRRASRARPRPSPPPRRGTDDCSTVCATGLGRRHRAGAQQHQVGRLALHDRARSRSRGRAPSAPPSVAQPEHLAPRRP